MSGKTTPKFWTEEEDNILRSMYLTHERTEIAAALGRTESSIRKRCSVLGLNYKCPHVTDGEMESIRQWYTERASFDEDDFALDELAKELGRTKQLISRMAGKLGLTNYSRSVGETARRKIGDNTKRFISQNGHPRGMLGKKHTDEFKAGQSERVKARVFTPEQREAQITKMMKTKIERYGTGRPGWNESSNPYSHAKRGRREDLNNIFFRSAWEANYARYLNWLIEKGEIKAWQFECQTFVFYGVTRGVVSYMPDFKVINNDGSHEWHEVKGWMKSTDRTKIKRMAKYYPGEKVVLIDRAAYRAIAKWKAMIPGWEETGT